MDIKKSAMCLLLVISVLLSMQSVLAIEVTPVDILSETEVPVTVEGQMHYLFGCLRGYDVGEKQKTRIAGLLIVTVDTNRSEIMFTTITPQTFVQQPDGEIGSLYSIESYFGIDELLNIISTHYGLKVDRYILMDYNGIINVINDMGGVNLELSDVEFEEIISNPFYSKDQVPISLQDDLYTCQGSFAIHFMRERGSGDYLSRRTNRANAVIYSLAQKIKAFDMTTWIQLAQVFNENITRTNISMNDLLLAISSIYKMDNFRIRQLNLPQFEDATLDQLIAVYNVNYVACREKLQAFLYGAP